MAIRGLEIFTQHFAAHQDQYVMIGGVAAWLTMDEAGASFRATKDLDIVLVMEALDKRFVAHFWDFIKAGGYQIQQGDGERPVFSVFSARQMKHTPYNSSCSPALLMGLNFRKTPN